MAEVLAAVPPDVLIVTCSAAEAAAVVPATGNNPALSAKGKFLILAS